MSSSETALLFPGQGAHALAMLDVAGTMPGFDERCAIVRDALGSDPVHELANENLSYLNENKVSSLLTALVSSVYLKAYRAGGGSSPRAVAGYSVGQWTALYAAGSIDFEALIAIISRRADRMDACIRGRPSGMLAVIGLPESAVQAVCDRVAKEGDFLAISNFNCAGQFSLAGTAPGIAAGMAELQALKPKKLVALPVSGAWHCELLAEAATRFRNDLEGFTLAAPSIPVIDNTTGTRLPESGDALRDALAAQISRPVRWGDGVHELVALGCTRFVEIGYGSTLTRFGFFVDRSVKHEAYSPPCAE